MKAMRDAGVLVLIVVAALAIRVGPVDTPAEEASQRTDFPSVVATPAVAAAPMPVPNLLLVDVEDLEIDAIAADAQPLAMRSLESLEVGLTELALVEPRLTPAGLTPAGLTAAGLTDVELEEMSVEVAELVQALVLGAAQGPATELLSHAATALEAAASAAPCPRAG